MAVTVQGERWFPLETSFADEKNELWGDWYCDSEIGVLQAVLMHRPGKEIEGITEENYTHYRFRAPIDPVRAREQQDALTDLYRSHGVEVYYVKNQREDKPNAMYMRDSVFMTPEGAIIARQGIASRRGEERAIAASLAELGVPIIKTINGDGIFEGASAMWLDRNTVIIGTGSRTNDSGANQVEAELRNMGVTNVIRTQIPYGSLHLDGFMNMFDKKKFLIFPWHMAYDLAKALLDMGYTLIEATDLEEVKNRLSTNFVALAPGKIVMPAGNPNTKAVLEKEGAEVLEVELDEILNGWGSIHCMTAFLKREPLEEAE